MIDSLFEAAQFPDAKMITSPRRLAFVRQRLDNLPAIILAHLLREFILAG